MIGRTLSHYEILGKLGEGGMGTVYRARDTKLERVVALKILPPESVADPDRKRRFVQEARAASALNHPNIVTIYEIDAAGDVDFIAMEHVEGETLGDRIGRGRLPVGELVDLALQVTDAMDAAHERGIVHRDLKPANIMVTPRGRAKVLDFGLARLAPPPGPDSVTRLGQTVAGVVAGTVHYMSPEQALGRAVDHRSDLFSLGAVLYEMATGRQAFQGGSVIETIDRILHAEVDPLPPSSDGVPMALEPLIRKCLEKDPGRRYQSARELLVDLRALQRGEAVTRRVVTPASQPPVARRRGLRAAAGVGLVLGLVGSGVWYFGDRVEAIDSVAVLPLVNSSGNPDTDYLSEGITETLINNLSLVPDLRVSARTTVFRYKGRDADPLAIGRELGVGAVVTGQIADRDGTLVVQAELVDVASGSQLWGARYNRRASDLMALEAEISREISAGLHARLTAGAAQRLAARPTENVEAYQLYLRGRHHLNASGLKRLNQSVEYFRQAIEKEPLFAKAHAALAEAYGKLGALAWVGLPPGDYMPKSKAAALKAIEIDDTLAEAHSSLAMATFLHEWDWAGAEREFKRALALNPNSASARSDYATFLAAMGRLDEAHTENRRALEIDPLSYWINAVTAIAFYWDRQPDRALEAARHAIELEPQESWGHIAAGYAYEQKGLLEQAIAAQKSPPALVHVLVRAGRRDEALTVAQRLIDRAAQDYVSPYLLAYVYAGIGDRDRAFEWLDKAIEERSPLLLYVNVHPHWDGLRDDPRFDAVVRRIGLPQASRTPGSRPS